MTSFVVLFAAALAANNWPQFRGPGASGVSDDPNLPDKWSQTENVVWKVPVAGLGWSSPVVWGNQVWLTNAPEIQNTTKEQPKLDQTYNAAGKLNDTHAVKVAMTNASLYAYVADGKNGLQVVQ